MRESVTLVRDYPLPPAHVFRAWTDVELLGRWFGCGPDMLWTIHEWDVRVGGAIHVSLLFDKGPYVVRGEFLIVDPPRRLRYRFGDAHIVDVTIEAHGAGSRVTVRNEGLDTPDMRATIEAGWTSGLAQLGALVATAPVS